MRFYSQEEAEVLRGCSGSLPTYHSGELPENEVISVRSPLEACHISMLSQAIVEIIKLPCTLAFGDKHVWTSCSNWPLAEAVKRGLGEEREWHLVPYARIEEEDKEALVTLLSLSLLCLWDLEIIEEIQPRKWSLSHDEFVDCWSSDPKLLDEAREVLSGWLWQV